MSVELRGAGDLPTGDHGLVFSLSRGCRPDCELTTGGYALEVRVVASDSDRNEWLSSRATMSTRSP